MKITFDASPNFTTPQNSQSFYGRPRTFEVVVLHWWGLPANNPTLQGTVNYLKNPANHVSAHYVVSDDKIIQLVKEENIAWHARNANPFSIGIEIDPNTPGKTYETVKELVQDIFTRRGVLKIEPHSKYVATMCPGTIDIDRIRKAVALPLPNPGYAPTHEGQTVSKDGITYQSYKDANGKLLWKIQAADPCATQNVRIKELEQLLQTEKMLTKDLTIKLTNLTTQLITAKDDLRKSIEYNQKLENKAKEAIRILNG